ncbi:putative lin1 family protein [Phaeoacremonium minimum UCRPA7]|uniref:Putative lin1 family protein n=1 Tax=Phaeoacremonium minimum (strain UCR-PA7) TaxID=1286976 RepID=R8BYF2_PHAM7|nr:putative lin1 family protein [Phaeoacremonium minimum UCRPA7]EOO04324.1 putative lin1 family protein [Phaeoacremonium minimum UCRPA7]
MSSRFSAARPKRAGEAFARTHHGEREEADGGPSSKKVKFDVRNPSALAPDAREDDDVLDADVIGVGSGAATKRGAVNIDGYDSDSDNEAFYARAEARKGQGKKGKAGGDEDVNVDLAEQLDNYDKNLKSGGQNGAAVAVAEDEDDDMFADPHDAEAENGDPAAPDTTSRGKKGKEVHFMDADDIEGQEANSKGGGHVHINDEVSSDDEEDVELAIQEEGLDEEIGAGGLKRNAPKIDAFNMKQEQEEGGFDEAGNFIRKAVDPDAVHDRWLEGVSKKEMRKAAAAHEKREAELRQQRKEDDSIITADLLKALVLRLEKGETALEALARLGKGQTKPKKVPKWKLKKQKNGADAMDVDKEKETEDPEQVRIKEAINAITEAADKLLGRDYPEIYDTERELLIREHQNETGERWVEPPKSEVPIDATPAAKMWEFRWIDGRDDAALQGPYDGPTMDAWQKAGYFTEGVEFRPAGDEAGWTRVADFV